MAWSEAARKAAAEARRRHDKQGYTTSQARAASRQYGSGRLTSFKADGKNFHMDKHTGELWRKLRSKNK